MMRDRPDSTPLATWTVSRYAACMQCFFTICATNYLAFARQLGESVLLHQGDASFTIWLLDRGELPEFPEGFQIRYVDELLPVDERERLAFYYEIIEQATAVKPLCFQRHFQEDAASVIYLDPDIVLFRPLTEVNDRLAQGATGVLTPHITEPLPRDGAAPDDLVLLGAGIYNLGFLALARHEASDQLLDWWWGWLRTHCFADKVSGTFTDQKWINFVPLFWPQTSILRDTTYNVAYWNLAQRRFEQTDDGFTVDGQPLTFFHFSGFDPDEPGVLSKHQNRLDVGRRSPLASILGDYATKVQAAGHARLRTCKPPAIEFAGGIALDPIARVAFREAQRRGLKFRDLRTTGIGTFYNWLTSTVSRDLQAAGSPPLSRYLMTLYDLRSDVRQTYPDVFGADRIGYLEWVRQQAVAEMDADPKLIAKLLATAPPPLPRTGEEPKAEEPAPEYQGQAPVDAKPETSEVRVHLVGYLRAALGLGEAARGYAQAMLSADISLRYTDVTYLTASPIDDAVRLEETDSSTDDAIHVIHVNADQLLRLHEQAGAELFASPYNIGVWAWETQEFPEAWHDRFRLLNEIWVPSAFIADAVGSVSPLPVVRIPHVIQVPHVSADRARFGYAGDECVFLFYFDFHSTTTRKNPRATIEAFRRAFKPGDPARLVLKSINGRNCPKELAELKAMAEGLTVTFIDEVLDGDDRFVLLASCDCFVSLHRAEGFGLGMAEAMAMEKPVIATGWSGNMDFMTPSNSFPVGFQLAPLADAAPPYPAGTIWAEPDIDHAARLMQDLAADRERGRAVGRRARRDIEASHSPEVIGRLIRRRLERVQKIGHPTPTAGLADSSIAPPDPPAPSALSPAPPAAVQARSLLFRALRQSWRLTLHLAPTRYHPRLHRHTSRLRALLGVG